MNQYFINQTTSVVTMIKLSKIDDFFVCVSMSANHITESVGHYQSGLDLLKGLHGIKFETDADAFFELMQTYKKTKREFKEKLADVLIDLET